MIGYGTIFQVGYVVDDLDAALAHWIRRLQVGPFFAYPSPMPWVSLTVDGAPATDTNIIERVALAYSGELMIELIQPGAAPSAYRDFLAAGLRGVQHLGAATDRFDADRERALANGGRELMAGVLPASRFSYIAFGDGFAGSVLELIELGPDRIALFETIKAAARDWDGSDPVRAARVGMQSGGTA